MFKRFVKEYLTFSRKERLGLLTIIALVMFGSFGSRLFDNKTPVSITPDSTLIKTIDTLRHQPEPKYEATEETYPVTSLERPERSDAYIEGELFYFDPNCISPSEWKRLGLNERTTRILLNYRNKGGKFYKKEDLLKIWSMPVGFYNRVENYIVIPARISPSYPQQPQHYSSANPTKIPLVDVNTADSTALEALPGIGTKLSARIIKFRDLLGGFYSIEQLAEVYNLPDSTFQLIKRYIVISKPVVKVLNINTATKEQLKSHPYIRWKIANAIVEFRNQHGNFTSIEDLLKINVIDEKNFSKMKPYLSL